MRGFESIAFKVMGAVGIDEQPMYSCCNFVLPQVYSEPMVFSSAAKQEETKGRT